MRWWGLPKLMYTRRLRRATHLGLRLEEHGIAFSRPQLSRLTRGEFSLIRVDVIEALCEILACSPAELFTFGVSASRSNVATLRADSTLFSARATCPSWWGLPQVMHARGIRRQSQLGRELEAHGICLDRTALSRIVRGRFCQIRVILLEALCAVLQCSPSELLLQHAGNAKLAMRPGRVVSHTRAKRIPVGELKVRPISARLIL